MISRGRKNEGFNISFIAVRKRAWLNEKYYK
jgi:hypothetical protein